MKIRRIVASIYASVRNLCTFAKVIYKWRFWDYSYMLAVIDKMLEECEKRWVKETHYVGDKFTKGRIMVVRRDYYRYMNASDFVEQDKLEKRFLRRFARLLPRLWD